MAEANGAHPHTVQLSNILLGSKSGTVRLDRGAWYVCTRFIICQRCAPAQSKGQLLVNHKGVFWRKSGSDRTIEARRNGANPADASWAT